MDILRFASYEAYLDSVASDAEKDFLEDPALIRQVLELRLRKSSVLSRDEFEIKRSEAKGNSRSISSSEFFTKLPHDAVSDIVLKAVLARHDKLLAKELVSIFYIKQINEQGKQVSGFIDANSILCRPCGLAKLFGFEEHELETLGTGDHGIYPTCDLGSRVLVEPTDLVWMDPESQASELNSSEDVHLEVDYASRDVALSVVGLPQKFKLSSLVSMPFSNDTSEPVGHAAPERISKRLLYCQSKSVTRKSLASKKTHRARYLQVVVYDFNLKQAF